jgi:hypothetical protein
MHVEEDEWNVVAIKELEKLDEVLNRATKPR